MQRAQVPPSPPGCVHRYTMLGTRSSVSLAAVQYSATSAVSTMFLSISLHLWSANGDSGVSLTSRFWYIMLGTSSWTVPLSGVKVPLVTRWKRGLREIWSGCGGTAERQSKYRWGCGDVGGAGTWACELACARCTCIGRHATLYDAAHPKQNQLDTGPIMTSRLMTGPGRAALSYSADVSTGSRRCTTQGDGTGCTPHTHDFPPCWLSELGSRAKLPVTGAAATACSASPALQHTAVPHPVFRALPACAWGP